MRFIDHHVEIAGVVQVTEFAARRVEHFLELLDRGHHRSASAATQQFAQLAGATGAFWLKCRGPFERIRDLPVELGPVGDDDDGWILQLRGAAQFGRQPEHGERLTRALGVPHDAASLLGLATLEDALHRLLDGSELLVAWQLLDQLALRVLVDDEVSEDVEQGWWIQQAGDEACLAFGRDAEAVLELGFAERLY